MIKTLKAASILVVICAVALVALVVVLGIRGDQQIAEFLDAPGVIEKFRKFAKTVDDDVDQVSPLIEQAKAFALRINPPPPPKPKRSKATPQQRAAKKRAPASPRPKAPVTARFKLVATCRYKLQPERSLALVDRPPQGLKWFRQGDNVGHLTIQQVKDGSIVCSDGQELFVPPSKVKTKTLLKSELTDSARPRPTISTPLEQPVEGGIDAVERTALEPQPDTVRRPRRRSQPAGAAEAKPKLDSTKRGRVRRLPPQRARNLSPEQVIEQRKESVQQSIATIKEMMNQSDSLLGDEEEAKELKIWEQLLEGLEKERAEIEKGAD